MIFKKLAISQEEGVQTPDFPILPYSLKRFELRGQRYYYFTQGEAPDVIVSEFMPSATTICKGLPEYEGTYHLDKWMIDQGSVGAAAAAMNSAGDRGSFFHEMTKEIATRMIMLGREASISVEEVYDLMRIFTHSRGRTDAWVHDNMNETLKDLASFMAFVREKNVVFLLVEKSIMGPIKGNMVSATLDLYCEMDVEKSGFWGERYASGEQKGKPKKTKATFRERGILDWKSGKSGFYLQHEIQLRIADTLFRHNFPDHPVQFIANWAPTDWRETPGWSLKFYDLEDEVARKKLEMCADQFFLYNEPIDDQHYETSIEHALGIGQNHGLIFNKITVRDFVTNRENFAA